MSHLDHAWTATVAVAATLVASVALAPSASAKPNSADGCTFEHGLRPASDSTGSWWQLSLDAECPDDSGVSDIEWEVSLYATRTDGVRHDADEDEWFVGGPGTPERLARPGRAHWVERGAPRGRARYCYEVTARYRGVLTGAVDGAAFVPEESSGRRCLDGIGS